MTQINDTEPVPGVSRQEHPRPENAVANVSTWNYLQITSPRYLDLTIHSDIFPWTPLSDGALLLDEMPLENRNQEMYDSLELVHEDHTILIENNTRRRATIVKRPALNYSLNQEGSVFSNPFINDNNELQIIISGDRAGYPTRYIQWQVDENQTFSVSSIQMQTDVGNSNLEITINVNASTTGGFLASRRVRRVSSQETNSRRRYIGSSTANSSSSLSTTLQNGQNSGFNLNTGNTDDFDINPDPENLDTLNSHPEIERDITREDLHSVKPMINYFSPKSVGVDGLTTVGPYKMHTYSAPIPALPAPTSEARQVANNVIRHARSNKTLDRQALNCLDCDLIPILPVTGQCGHTRCIMCIQNNGACPCGVAAPKHLHVNTLIQYLIGKMLRHDFTQRDSLNTSRRDETLIVTADVTDSMAFRRRRQVRIRRSLNYYNLRIFPYVNQRTPMVPQKQFEYARRLMMLGRYRDAAPHFARVAASYIPLANTSRRMLAQSIDVLAGGRHPRHLTRDLFKSVRLQSASSWIQTADLECILCYNPYTQPVTTPCGHTYCRTCIDQALDYRKACSLCARPLPDFKVSETNETTFIKAGLEAIGAYGPSLPLDPDVIHIFVCTVAFPCISCPLLIFDPRYWLMIRRVLESGSRKFGMVTYDKDKNYSYSDYGTILEVCDCVQLHDGRSLLSTVGVSRFRVIERYVRDGCDVARVQILKDIPPTNENMLGELRLLGSQVMSKALKWLNSMNKEVRQEIETSFGEIPRTDDVNEDWCISTDGPAWLWWLIAILPLRPEIKILILSTKNLLKRLMAVSRTLDAIDHVALTTTSSNSEFRSALTNAEEWLERGT